MKSSTTCFIICITVLSLSLSSNLFSQEPDDKPQADEIRIGTFDSRALAMAWYRSPTFKEQMSELHAAHQRARASGDEERVKELEARGPTMQDLMHKQGFGTWPVDNILEKIKDEIPGIAEQAGVSVIVSKWDIVHQTSGIEFVDVTDQMVAPFEPDEATRKVIEEIREKKPVPLEQLENHQH